MLIYVLIGVAVLVVLLVVVIALRPNTFRVERSAVIHAPPAACFAQVNDFHAWVAWSPWEKIDPQLDRTYSGPSSGVGAKYAWLGNRQVGQGNMTIEQSDAPTLIGIRLEFIKPFAGVNAVTFRFTPIPGDNGTGTATKVTWTMDGKYIFITKAFCLFMDMDKMIGKDFERGLAGMKQVAEQPVSHSAALAPAL